jgi:hypothetical protein
LELPFAGLEISGQREKEAVNEMDSLCADYASDDEDDEDQQPETP